MQADRQETLCCPTCRARQAPSRECRRCKCDLSLVTAAWAARRRLHVDCLRRLREGRYLDALQTARRRWSLSPDREAARLVAVSALLAGRFQTALDVYDAQGASGREERD